MAGTSYTRQSTIADGNIITAALFNNEFNQLLNAFAYASSGTTGHSHDGSAGQGAAISKIGDQDFNNKVVISATDNRIEFYCEVSGSPVEQVRIQDGAIVPVTDSDVDLGTTSVRFKDAYIDSATVTGTVTANAISTTANSTLTGATFAAGTDVTFTGASANIVFDTSANSFNFADNAEAVFGTHNDLKIYHDGSNSYIKEVGTGNVFIQGDAEISLGSAFGQAQVVVKSSSDGVELYYDTSKRFETTSSGATVSGSLSTSGAVSAVSFLASTNIDTPQIEVTSLRARDGSVAGSIADSTGIITLNNSILTTTTINGGGINNTIIGASTPAAGNFTTLDATNIEVTNLKAKDGTSAGSIADSTGVVTLASSVLTTADINGGTADNVVIGGSTAAAGTFTSVTATASSSITGSETSSTDPIATINRTGNDGVILELQQDGTTNAEFFSTGGNRLILCDNTGDGIKFTPTSMHPRTSTNGAYDDSMDLGLSSSAFRDLYLGGGVYIGGTDSANYLDAYEEGDFSSTIGLSDGTNEATTSSSTFFLGNGTQAYYTIVGRMVTCNIRLNNIETSGMIAGNQLKITNLPANTRSSHVPVAPVYTVQVDKASAATGVFGVGSGNSDELPLRVVYEGGGTAALTTSMLSTSGNSSLILTLTYITP